MSARAISMIHPEVGLDAELVAAQPARLHDAEEPGLHEAPVQVRGVPAARLGGLRLGPDVRDHRTGPRDDLIGSQVRLWDRDLVRREHQAAWAAS
jgi:hypothetical protein